MSGGIQKPVVALSHKNTLARAPPAATMKRSIAQHVKLLVRAGVVQELKWLAALER